MNLAEITKHFKLQFNNAYLRLTLFYVLIVMTISIGFSYALFNISSKELNKGLTKQNNALRDTPINQNMQNGAVQPFSINFEDLRSNQIEESNKNLRNNLICFNLIILAISSFASYFLAKKTMSPIEEALEAQNRFTTDASHELRTPLSAMRAEIEVALRDEKFNLSEAKKLLQSNLEETEKLESLSNALLKLARYQENDDYQMEKVSLKEIIVEAYEKVEKMANKKSIEFENDFLDLYTTGCHQNLTELFVILLENAIKYSPEKSKIHILMKKENDKAIVKIKDEGIGIKASDLPYIFNRFYRSDISRSKEKINGYGLGLSIAHKIIEIHNGVIAVSSKQGKGSEFSVKLAVLKQK